MNSKPICMTQLININANIDEAREHLALCKKVLSEYRNEGKLTVETAMKVTDGVKFDGNRYFQDGEWHETPYLPSSVEQFEDKVYQEWCEEEAERNKSKPIDIVRPYPSYERYRPFYYDLTDADPNIPSYPNLGHQFIDLTLEYDNANK